LDIRFDEEPKKGQSPTTRLYMPNKDEGQDTESRPRRSAGRKKSSPRGVQEPHVHVEKPEMNPLARIGLILCGFIFAGMVLFTLAGYERITRAYADINALNDEIEETELRINELDVQIECAVTIQDAQAVAEQYGMQYPEQNQYVKIGDTLPFSGSDASLLSGSDPTETEDATNTDTTTPDTTTPDTTGDTGDSTDGGDQPSEGG
jgi:hypothetical protein